MNGLCATQTEGATFETADRIIPRKRDQPCPPLGARRGRPTPIRTAPRFSLRTAKTHGIFRGIGRHRVIGRARRAQAFDQRPHAARRDRTGDLVVRHARAYAAQHAADADGDVAALLGDRNDVALRFAFEARRDTSDWSRSRSVWTARGRRLLLPPPAPGATLRPHCRAPGTAITGGADYFGIITGPAAGSQRRPDPMSA
jgi:hypothetical protein